MKLVSKDRNIVIDETTFQPHLRITIDVPLELIQDTSVQVNAAEIIGIAFIDMINANGITHP